VKGKDWQSITYGGLKLKSWTVLYSSNYLRDVWRTRYELVFFFWPDEPGTEERRVLFNPSWSFFLFLL